MYKIQHTAEKSRFDKELSEKLKLVSLVSIFLVLLNHAQLPDIGLRRVISTITRPNRVLFFGVAGFLFTFGFPFLKERLFQKWYDRAKTLLVPYLLTIVAGKLAVIVTIFLFPKEWLNKSQILVPVWNYGDVRWADLMRSNESRHLWFLEGLMLAVVVYGAVLVCTRWNQAVHVALVAASLAGFYVVPAPHFQGLLFFGGGTLLARRVSLLTSAGPGLAWTGALGMAWGGCILGFLSMTAATQGSVASNTLLLFNSCIGAVFLWLAIDRIPDALRKVLAPFCPYVFPIYLIHFSVLWPLRKVALSLLGVSLLWNLAGVIVVTLLTAYGSFLLARSIETAFPSFAALWFGGRGAARQGAARTAKEAATP